MKSSRKIKNSGINPSNSFLVHPITLQHLKNNNKDDTIKEDFNKIMLIPEIKFDEKKILSYYNINYIQDLEDNFSFYSNSLKLRLLKLYFNLNRNIKNITSENFPNIFDFIANHYKINQKNIENKFKKLSQNTFEELFS